MSCKFREFIDAIMTGGGYITMSDKDDHLELLVIWPDGGGFHTIGKCVEDLVSDYVDNHTHVEVFDSLAEEYAAVIEQRHLPEDLLMLLYRGRQEPVIRPVEYYSKYCREL